MNASTADSGSDRLDQWVQWLHVIRDQIHTLYLWRTIWRAMIQAIEGNPEVPRTIVIDYLAGTYAARQAVAIRRICGEQKREISFKNLLYDIKAHPEVPTPRPINVVEVQRDIDSLHAGDLRLVRKYVSQYLAHNQSTPDAKVPTFADIHAAIDQLGVLLRTYVLLLEDADQGLEVFIHEDWTAIFRVPWLQEGRV